MVEGLATSIRAFLTRRVDTYMIVSYVVLAALVALVALGVAVIVAGQVSRL
jgi:hypothetical protein